MTSEQIIQSWKRPAGDAASAPSNPAGERLNAAEIMEGDIPGDPMNTVPFTTIACCTFTDFP